MNTLAPAHILPDKCPQCGEVVRNDMSVVTDPKTRLRTSGHVQFACNYEVEIPAEGRASENLPAAGVVLRACRKGQIWPTRT